jgi:SEC-C motif-containing protein
VNGDAEPCPCGAGRPFSACCGPFLAGAPAPTAEALMRSRYTAYVRGDVEHVLRTHRAPSGAEVDRAAVERFAREASWRGLEIVATERGGVDDDEGVVEFIARYQQGGRELAHHERSTFARVDGRWMFVDGAAVKAAPARRAAGQVGRNDPCPCGSGKKYKRCHG